MDISIALDILGYDTDSRKRAEETTLLLEYIGFHEYKIRYIFCGGQAEHSSHIVSKPDKDFMVVFDHLIILEENSLSDSFTGTKKCSIFGEIDIESRKALDKLTVHNFTSDFFASVTRNFDPKKRLNLLIILNPSYNDSESCDSKYIPAFISRKESYPGYCKLEIHNDNELFAFQCNKGSFLDMMHQSNMQFILKQMKKYQEKSFISSAFLHKEIVNNMNIRGLSVVVNGPALTYGDTDHVPCIEIDQLPKEVQTWRSRERRYNWPTKDTMKELKEISYHVVPVGSKHTLKTDPGLLDLEWRISFAEIERKLIWNMNDTQFKCFALLKAINKTFLNEMVSTYQIKTVLLWLCEKSPEPVWKSELLIKCVITGLMDLKLYIKENFLPHYIVPDNNLFLHKNITNPDEKRQALEIIEEVVNNLEICSMELFKTLYHDDLYTILDSNNEYIPNEWLLKAYTYGVRYCEIHNLALDYFEVFYKNIERSFHHIDREALKVVQSFFIENEQSKLNDTCRKLVARFGDDGRELVPCLKLEFLKNELRTFSRTDDEIDCYITKMFDIKGLDYMTVSVTCALIYFEYKRYADVRNTLLPVMKNNSYKLHIHDQRLPFLICLSTGSIKSYIGQEYLDDPIFPFSVCSNERNHFPYPLQLQLCLLGVTGCIMINPLVLSCYLIYTSCHTLERIEDMKFVKGILEEYLAYDINEEFKYVYFNLLGHMLYVTRTDITLALEYLIRSGEINPSLNNAAFYHIALIIHDMLTHIKGHSLEW